MIATIPVSLEGGSQALAGAFGRGGIQCQGDLVIRPYRRGGWLRRINPNIYASHARFTQEFCVHQALWRSGFPTVEPIGYAFRSCGWGVEGLYLTRRLDARPWPSCWAQEPSVAAQVAELLDLLSAWGLRAPDLNATNVLVDPEGRVSLLDWDRARWQPSGDLRARYQERLVRSLVKLQAPQPILADLQARYQAC